MAAGPAGQSKRDRSSRQHGDRCGHRNDQTRDDRAPHRVRHGHQQGQARPIGRHLPSTVGRRVPAERCTHSGVRRPASHQRQRIGQPQTASSPHRRLAQIPGRVGPGGGERAERCGDADADGGESDDDRPSGSIDPRPESGEIARRFSRRFTRSLSCRVTVARRQPRPGRQHREGRDSRRHRRTRRNTKAANGEPKATADGQQHGDHQGGRRTRKQAPSAQ